jgi:putative membrane protein
VTDIPLLNALLFAALGIVVYVIALAVLVKLPPFDLWKQIVTERNVAAGVVAGAVALGLAWIVAATMH